MAQTDRLLGRDTSIIVVANNVTLTTIRAVKSFSGKFNIKVIEENYIGRSATSYDNIYEGFDGSIKFDFDDDDTFKAYEQLIQAAQDRRKKIQLNITATFRFTTRLRKIQMPGCTHGPLPFDVGGRDRYVEGGFDVKCGNQIVFL